MTRNPLFREEDKMHQRLRSPAVAAAPQAANKTTHQKASPSDALWNRMNTAMRLSCQQSKPPLK